ncbi:hypothetical protein MMC16_003568 [Acarospora aff. strigata]|nr:hypothetical protein [Acarospora aff. strigata]
MSRRAPNPAADRAAQNQQTIKSLLKLEGNKSCADCKRNKHPRWASWNLGIFVCIRYTTFSQVVSLPADNIDSRVKSVDLDAWTDEQLQSVLRWGNSRANKYWEAKLAPGHVPSEAKIENFIRTKYESKRWVMDGSMPDPATLDTEGDDDVPLNLVQQKAKLERASSQRASTASSQPTLPPRRSVQNVDFFNDDTPSPPARPSTTEPSGTKPPPIPPRGSAAPPKETKPGDSLLGLDFFGSTPSASFGRPSSTDSNPAGASGPSRPDLKQSILSLYASVPRPQPQTQPQHGRQASFGAMQSSSSQQQPSQSAFGGLNDAFSSLNVSSPTSQPPPQPQPPPQQQAKSSPFADFGNYTSQRSAPAAPKVTAPSYMSGGGFFDTAPKSGAPPKPPTQQPQRTLSSSSGFGDFSSASNTGAHTTNPITSSGMNDLFDFSESTPATAPSNSDSTPSNTNSAFNLSAPAAPLQPAPTSSGINEGATTGFSTFSVADPWGSNDAWATPEPAAPSVSVPKTSTIKSASTQPAAQTGFGWTPKISADEDFGGWNSAAPVSPASAAYPSTSASASTSTQPKKAVGGAGFSASDDLFSNVWE